MKKILSYIAVSICILCTVMVYLNMSTDATIAVEVGLSYANAALSSISSRIALSSFSSDAGENTSSTSSNNSLDISTSDWYTDMSNLKKGSCNVVYTVQGFDLYDSPTFDAEGHTFFFNAYKATCDLIDMLSGIGITTINSKEYIRDQWMNLESNELKGDGKFRAGVTYNKDNKYCKTKDGKTMLLFAPLPCACSDSYYYSGNWAKFDSYGADDLVNMYFNIVLVPQGADLDDQSNWLYLPATIIDVKAHTYPWGVTQTNLTVEGSSSNLVMGAGNNPGYNDRAFRYDGNITSTDFMKSAILSMDSHSKHKSTEMLYDRVEATNIETIDWNHGYDLVGFITYNGITGR